MKAKNKIHESKGDRLFNLVVAVIASVALVITLYPLVYVLSASFSSPFDLMAGRVWLWPLNVTAEGYKVVLEYNRIWSGFYNSLLITIGGTLINLFVTI
ncbi:MAG: carbohydrate ABC transporter permease, partial [Treponema sp.]|nr:carbohydrate ABC transporter permease [Treponema sp.]